MNSNIIRSWNGKTIRQRGDSYLSLTDMADATNKRVGNWLQLDGTKSYLKTLSNATGITATSDSVTVLALVQRISGGVANEQGTWGHKKVALRFAQWCSDDFAIQVDTWIEELLTTGTVSVKDDEESTTTTTYPTASTASLIEKQDAKALSDLIGSLFENTEVDPYLIAGLKANEVSKATPSLKPVMESAKKLLPLPIECELVTVTNLALKLTEETGVNFTARSLNKFLLAHDFQIKNPIDEPPYIYTEKGKPYSKIHLQEANGNNKTVQQLRWFVNVIDVLKPIILGDA